MATREVLYRGKISGTEEWIEGFYSAEEYDIDTHQIERIPRIQQLGKCMSFGIIPETRGEFTGLTDKNGVKIFEGDILEYKGNIATVKYEEKWARFITFRPNGDYYPHALYFGNVIGNIHDNPELIGGEQK